jgi:hypothetical protein
VKNPQSFATPPPHSPPLSFPTLYFFFPELFWHFQAIFLPYIEVGELAAVGYGDLACRRSARRLTLPAVAHGGWLPNPWGPTGDILTAVANDGKCWNRRGPQRLDVKSAKFSNRRIFLQNNFKKYKIKSKSCVYLEIFRKRTITHQQPN